MSGIGGSPAPGWYPAPDGRAAGRWWDGARWTPWLTDGRQTWSDAPARRPLTGDDRAALRFVEEVFLPEAVARGAVAPQQRADLDGLVRTMAAEAAAADPAADPAAAPATAPAARETATGPVLGADAFASPGATPYPAAPVAAGWPQVPGSTGPAAAGATPATPYPTPPAAYPTTPYPTAYPTTPYPTTATPATAYPTPYPTAYPAGPRATAPPPAALPRPPRPPHEPGRLARWWSETWSRIGSDVAVHGLAYLGVLLLFVGVFGLVAFAFGSVAPAARPVAELASAGVTFAAARLLLRHGATVVARAMEGVGGLILPLMVVTSTVDGFGFPPDLHGTAMPVVLAAICLALAAGYVAWIARHTTSGLRYVVAPTVWLGVAMGAIGIGRPIPTGQDIAVPGSGQVAAIAVAVLVTALATRVMTRGPVAAFAPATQSATLVGSVVVTVLGVVTWLADGGPTAAVVVTAVAIAATWQLLPRVPGAVADVGAVLWWALVATRLLAPDASSPVADWAAALGFVVVLELLGRRARSDTALALGAAGLVLTVLAVMPDAGWAAGSAPCWPCGPPRDDARLSPSAGRPASSTVSRRPSRSWRCSRSSRTRASTSPC